MPSVARLRLSRVLPTIVGIAAALAIFLLLRSDDGRALTGVLRSAGVADLSRDGALLGGALAGGAVAWSIAYLSVGPGGWLTRRTGPSQASRRPLSYTDLGPPPPREQPLPTDLDQPLSAYDPDALRPGVRRPT